MLLLQEQHRQRIKMSAHYRGESGDESYDSQDYNSSSQDTEFSDDSDEDIAEVCYACADIAHPCYS